LINRDRKRYFFDVVAGLGRTVVILVTGYL
jgi:hypothetical protein